MRKFLLLIALVASFMTQANAGVVLTENFGLFAAGSDTEPNANYMEDYIDSYTQTPGWSAIMDVANGPVEYYNIQGIRVATDEIVPGFYIVRQGEKSTKVLINK